MSIKVISTKFRYKCQFCFIILAVGGFEKELLKLFVCLVAWLIESNCNTVSDGVKNFEVMLLVMVFRILIELVGIAVLFITLTWSLPFSWHKWLLNIILITFYVCQAVISK